jgi:hypothetical protein
MALAVKSYFYGGLLTAFADYGKLKWLMEHELKGRLYRWQLFLQQFDFQVSYIKGKNNSVADCLSRETVTDDNGITGIIAITTDKDSTTHSNTTKVKNTRVEAVIGKPRVLEISNWNKHQRRNPCIPDTSIYERTICSNRWTGTQTRS